MNTPKAEIVLDFDESLQNLDELSQEDPNLFPLDQQDNWHQLFFNHKNYLRKLYTYFFQMRATFSVIFPDGKIDIELRNKIRKITNDGAAYLASRSLLRSELIRPQWVDLIESLILKHSDLPLLSAWKETELVLIDAPTVQALTELTDKGYKLYLSVLTRSFFRQMNTIIANIRHVFERVEKGEIDINDLTSEIDEIPKAYLGYCWFIRDEFDPGLIPFPYFNSTQAVSYASHIALLQSLLIVIHELGHIVLGHLDGSWMRTSIPDQIKDFLCSVLDFDTLSDKEIMELEADLYAFTTLLTWDAYDIDDKIFASLSLMDYLQMFSVTSSLKICNSEGETNTVKYRGLAFDRCQLANAFLKQFWSNDGEKVASNFFHNILVNKYLRDLMTISQAEIDKITDREYPKAH